MTAHPEPVSEPVVTYTVRELILRMDAKLDAYAQSQRDQATTLRELEPMVRDSAKKIEKLELIQLGRDAVKTWHSTAWRAACVLAGAVASFAITYATFHH